MSGNTIGAVVGGTIGFLVGGPAGAQIGFTIGSIVGGIVDPVRTQGPRLKDLQQQSAQEGAMIPFGYGTFPCPTQVIWQGTVVEHKHEEGGKGGPVNTTYTYTRSYAIGLCEGPITGVLKLWRNGKLVYDVSPTSTILGENSKFLEKCTFYLGGETQTVDPTIEAIEGVGETSPMRGLAHFVMEDDGTIDGEIAQYRAVVQMCGTVTTTLPENFLSTGQVGKAQVSEAGSVWTEYTTGLGVAFLRHPAALLDNAVGFDGSGECWYTVDRGHSWTQSVSGPFTGTSQGSAAGPTGHFVMLLQDGVDLKAIKTTDGGVTWAAPVTIIAASDGNRIAYGASRYVIAASTGLYSTLDGTSGITLEEVGAYTAVGFNRTEFLAGFDSGGGGATRYQFKTSTLGTEWTAAAGSMASAPLTICGDASYFVVGADGIHLTTNSGGSFTQVQTAPGVVLASSAAAGPYVVVGSGGEGGNTQFSSQNSGASFAQISPVIDDIGVAYMGPGLGWYAVPDAPGVYTDEDGNINSDYVAVGTSISSCSATLSAIVSDLCSRGGLTAAEVDTSQLTDTVKGYACATEGSAQDFIAPLTQAWFFDRGEWDKKIRFIKRGGASAFALTMDDLVFRDGPAIGQTHVQEVELLRKASIVTCDPDADFAMKPQSWERRIGTVNALGERTVEIPVVTDADTAKQIAHKTVSGTWAETVKFALAVPVKWSKLTATDVGTITDVNGLVHRIRITAQTEESGVFAIEEAVKDRASVYGSTAVGSVSTPGATATAPSLIGPTLLAAMNLPQMRSQDGAGLYIGMAGILPGWAGAQLLMSVDGGVSYSPVLNITAPTRMGLLTATISSSGTPLSVHIYGGDLSSKTTAQVLAGANYSAVTDAITGVSEVLAYETATETTADYYNLTVLTRAINGSVAADHALGDQFVDLGTAYFLPIDPAYAGVLWFKAVGLGVSADAVAAVSVTYAPSETIIDGGEVVGPLGLLDRAGASITDRYGQVINTRV